MNSVPKSTVTGEPGRCVVGWSSAGASGANVANVQRLWPAAASLWTKPTYTIIGADDSKKGKLPARPGAPTKRALSTSPPPLLTRGTGIQKKRDRSSTRCHSLSPSLLYTRKNQNQTSQETEQSKQKLAETKSVEEAVISAKMVELSTAIDEAKVSIPHIVVGKTHRLLSTKKREFLKLKKQVTTQQNALIEQLAAIKEIETRAGLLPDETFGEVTVLALKPWPAHDLLLLIKDVIDLSVPSDIDSFFGAKVLQKMNTKLSSIPELVQNLCKHMRESRDSYVAMVQQKMKSERYSHQTNSVKYEVIEKETEKLNNLVKDVSEKVKRKIDLSLKLAKLPWIDREILIKRVEKMQKENSVLQTKLSEMAAKAEGDFKQSRLEDNQLEQNSDLAIELQKERSAREALKEVVAAAENMLRVARARVSTLEKQVKDVRAELDVTKRKLKDVENFHRQRETTIDARSKKLLEVSKTGEITIETLSKQRDALEQRVKELHDQAEIMEKAAEKRLAEEKALQEKLQMKAAEQERERQAALARSAQVETRVKELEAELVKTKQYSSNLVELSKLKCLDYVPAKEKDPTYEETQLWQELQLTKDALAKKQEELRFSRLEKERFLQSLSNIAQGDTDERADKMAAALVEKEKKISELQQNIFELKERLESIDEIKTKFRSKITALRMEICRLRHYDCYAKDIPYQDLHHELLEMYMRVEALTRERAALVASAASRSLMLERQEKAVELFAKITRARHELAAHLEARPVEARASSLPFSEVSRSLSYLCANAAGTWNALRAERSHVFRLETAVMSQKQQLEREARVRTELQQRRAALERELARCHAILDGRQSRTYV